MEDNVEEPAGMGVPSSAAVKADPDEVAKNGIGGGGVVESAVLAQKTTSFESYDFSWAPEIRSSSSQILRV